MKRLLKSKLNQVKNSTFMDQDANTIMDITTDLTMNHTVNILTMLRTPM